MFEIEKGVPITRGSRGGRGRNRIYPFPTMAKNDSFVVPCSRQDSAKIAKKMHACAHYAYGSSGRITTAYLPKDKGVRVWRTK